MIREPNENELKILNMDEIAFCNLSRSYILNKMIDFSKLNPKKLTEKDKNKFIKYANLFTEINVLNTILMDINTDLRFSEIKDLKDAIDFFNNIMNTLKQDTKI